MKRTLANGRRHAAAVGVVATLCLLPGCSDPPDAVRPLTDLQRSVDEGMVRRVVDGDAARGRSLLHAHGCTSCHWVPGERQPAASVGPPLVHFARRTNIGGSLPNHPEQLVRFLMNAPLELPGTGMPDLALNEAEARDVAAFLYTLR